MIMLSYRVSFSRVAGKFYGIDFPPFLLKMLRLSRNEQVLKPQKKSYKKYFCLGGGGLEFLPILYFVAKNNQNIGKRQIIEKCV